MNLKETEEKVHEAIKDGIVSNLQNLLDNPNDHIQSMRKQGMHDQISFAVALDRVAIVKCLLDNGAEIHNGESMWKSIIQTENSTKIFELCMDGLLLRAHRQNPELTPALVKSLVLRSLEPPKLSFLQLVAMNGSPQMLQALLSYGTEHHFDHGQNKNILHAMISGWKWAGFVQDAGVEKIRLLCEAGAYMGRSTVTGLSIIHAAILHDMSFQAELVRMIINYMNPSCVYDQVSLVSGTDELEYVSPVVRVLTKHGFTTRDNRYDMLNMLFKVGAKRNQLFNEKPIMFTALQQELTWHAHIRRPSCLDVIVHGMDKFDKTKPRNCKYHWMVMQTVLRENPRHASSRNEILKILISEGFDPNEKDFLHGQTPLHYLIDQSLSDYERGDECLVETLLRCETVDVGVVDNRGQDMLKLVRSRIHDWKMSPLIYNLLYLKAEELIAKRDAFTLALHERLGAHSRVQILGAEMIGTIAGGDHFCHIPHPDTVFQTS